MAGNCAIVVCAAGGTTQSIPDDTDLPAAKEECATPTCSGGTKGSTPKAAGTACTGGICDGTGLCVPALGTPCTDASTCPSGFCVDGVCCNEACTGECKACNNDGSKGTCSNIAYYKEDSSWVPDGEATPRTCDSAIAGSRCDSKGRCLRTSGTACNDDATCMGGTCTNSKCLGAKGELCSAHNECASGMCSIGVCL